MASGQLERVALTLVADGKGILAADESVPTLTRRFDSERVESTGQRRNCLVCRQDPFSVGNQGQRDSLQLATRHCGSFFVLLRVVVSLMVWTAGGQCARRSQSYLIAKLPYSKLTCRVSYCHISRGLLHQDSRRTFGNFPPSSEKLPWLCGCIRCQNLRARLV